MRERAHYLLFVDLLLLATNKSIDIRNYDCRHGNLIENNHDRETDSPNSTFDAIAFIRCATQNTCDGFRSLACARRNMQTMNLCVSLNRMIEMCLNTVYR